MSHSKVNRKVERRGSAAVEMAAVLLPFTVFIFAVFEYGQYGMTRQVLVNAARSGARLATVNTDVNGTASNKTVAEIQQHIKTALARLRLRDILVHVYRAEQAGTPAAQRTEDWQVKATFQHRIAIEITANYIPLFPTFGMLSGTRQNTIPMGAQSVMHSEGN